VFVRAEDENKLATYPTSMQFRKAIHKHAINRPYVCTSISNSMLAKTGQLKGTLPDPLGLPQTTLPLSNLLQCLLQTLQIIPAQTCPYLPRQVRISHGDITHNIMVHCTIKVCNFQPILLTQRFWQPLVRQQPCCRA
jgi:hypothetical protein